MHGAEHIKLACVFSRRVRNIAKSDCYLRYVSPYVFSYGYLTESMLSRIHSCIFDTLFNN